MFDSRSFRQLMGRFATGITVVTAYGPDKEPVGITINSFTSVSLKPPLVLFCLEKNAHVYAAFKSAKHFAVNILGETQEEVSRYFADFRHHKKPKLLWDKPQKNAPILRDTLGWMLCEKTTTYKGGDHTIILGEAVKLHKRSTPQEPLLYFHGKYRRIKKVSA